MNNDLAPKYQKKIGDYWILWYSKSNNYSVVESEFNALLKLYLNSNSIENFKLELAKIDSISNADVIAKKLQFYLEDCNAIDALESALECEFNPLKSQIQKHYNIGNKSVHINYDSELVSKIIHPSIAHLEVAKSTAEVVFDLYLDNDLLCLFKNRLLVTAVTKGDYHLLQGKFVMQLLSLLHDKSELDWIGSFHGSTLSDGKNSVLFVGQSGKGKSTLCALLTTYGFELVADDLSPLSTLNQNIYHNPSAISIKKGAFSILKPLIKNFDEIPTTVFNKTKGKLKYLPCKTPKNYNYPCKCVVMVNYCKDAVTTLEKCSAKTILETLIPESWISPNPVNAKQFINWAASINAYTLTYSDTESMVKQITALFKALDTD